MVLLQMSDVLRAWLVDTRLLWGIRTLPEVAGMIGWVEGKAVCNPVMISSVGVDRFILLTFGF